MAVLNVALLFGGESLGHDMSMSIARSVYEALDTKRHSPILVGVAPDGRWWLQEDTKEFPSYVNSSGAQLTLLPAGGGKAIVHGQEYLRTCDIDVAFPISPCGGAGLLEAAQVPFVGSRGPAPAICSDKQITKRVLRDAGLPIVKYLALTAREEVKFQFAQEALCSCSLFVKPARIYNSIGVSKVTCESEFLTAVDLAFSYDSKVLVEECVQARELECAVLQDVERPRELSCSWPSEIISDGQGFYTAQAKLDEKGVVFKTRAELDEATAHRVRSLSCEAFKVIGCEGLARVDIFMRPNGELLVNEVGNAPALGPGSAFSRMMEGSGMGYKVLVQRLLEDAIRRSERPRAIL
ncbi:D-alanine--D-alanine ligase [Bradyrhizobium sp. 197]|uniref:D-alanine--D-alanine ligase n=1 Tax=Bradyrhizobium sp. 197 TaxID=2782663 RepID=UPI001FFB09A2|nr:D-alanine--D-alanine ligase [Bradyrhizobium sp. 197]MCK1478321.1 D-alanine--D-alanine ligase [Bradyrhizobium sp. 197]